MSVPSDKEIKKAATAILKECDLSLMTLKIVRNQLEENFGCSLAEKKDIIRESLEKFLAKNETLIEYNSHVAAENVEVVEEARASKTSKPKKGVFNLF